MMQLFDYAVDPSSVATFEGLEGRLFMAGHGMVEAAPIVDAGPAVNVDLARVAKKAKAASSDLATIRITSVVLENGQLIARGLIGNQALTAPLTASTSPNPADATCPILNLEIGALHLDLLGLVVDTSDICIRITAHEGEGLLGDLLCGISGALGRPGPGGILGNILGGLSQANLNEVLGGLTRVLDRVFGQLGSPANLLGVTQVGSTNILNLEVGPIDLNLLGLQVEADDCDGGPITVDITAEQGPGKLLGNLLGGLANLLNSNANVTALANALGRLARELRNLLG